MGIRLWVDDERPAPDDTWTIATSVEAARTILQGIDPKELEWVSLDYVLGPRMADSGQAVLEFMLEEHIIPGTLTVHSSSAGGNQLMIHIAREAGIDASRFDLKQFPETS